MAPAVVDRHMTVERQDRRQITAGDWERGAAASKLGPGGMKRCPTGRGITVLGLGRDWEIRESSMGNPSDADQNTARKPTPVQEEN